MKRTNGKNGHERHIWGGIFSPIVKVTYENIYVRNSDLVHLSSFTYNSSAVKPGNRIFAEFKK